MTGKGFCLTVAEIIVALAARSMIGAVALFMGLMVSNWTGSPDWGRVSVITFLLLCVMAESVLGTFRGKGI